MIFGTKMGEYLRRKYWMTGGGYKTFTPVCFNYSSVVSGYTVRIALTIEALNGLKFLVCGSKMIISHKSSEIIFEVDMDLSLDLIQARS